MNWRFTLTNTDSGDLILSDEPIGWDSIVINLTRDRDSHGLFFESAVSLKFYGEGRNYIKNIYETFGIDAFVGLIIDIQCSDEPFQNFFTGKLLLSASEFDDSDDCFVTLPIDPGGCLMQFRNRIDQEVDLNTNLDFDGNALAHYDKMPFNMELLAKTIVLREVATDYADAFDVPVIPEYTSPPGSIASGIGTQHFGDLAYIGLPTGVVSINEIGLVENTTDIGDFSTVVPLVTCEKTGTFNIDISLSRLKFNIRSSTAAAIADCSGNDVQEVQIIFYIEVNGSPVYTDSFYNDTDCASSRDFNFINKHWNQDVFMNAGDILTSFIRIISGGTWHRDLVSSNPISFIYNDHAVPDPDDPSHGFIGLVDCFFNITEKLYNAPTDAQVYMVNEALSRTIEGITDDCMRVKSNYFGRTDSQPYTSVSDGCGSLEVITKGLLIRGFPIDNVIMPVSFSGLFNSLSAIHCLGFGQEDDAARPGHQVIRVEPMEYFYDSAIILTCDNVPSIKKTVKPQWFPSKINIGYNKWEAENSMGLDEFCTKRSYRTTLSEIKNEVSKIADLVASGYAIEVTRNIEYVDQSTKDWRYDNDIFIICTRRDGPSGIVVEQGVDCADTGTMTNIIDPLTIYNYRISPIRNLLRWLKFYMPAYFNDISGPNAKFIFTTADGNFLAKGKLITGCIEEATNIAENEDIDLTKFAIPSNGYPLFRNETDSFDYPLSYVNYLAIKANPRGIIQYRKLSTDSWSQGYISTIQYKPNDGMASFTLIPKF